MSIRIKEFAFVYHPVTDVPGARKFYEQVLNLKLGFQIELEPGKWWIEYDIAGQALAVSNLMPGAPSTSLALEVVDFDAAYQGAKAAGVTIVRDAVDFGVCRMFGIKDPAGNEITLHHRKAGA